MKNASFHIQNFPANDIWPNGGWSVYRINGDQIAQRIVFDGDMQVIRRDPWCGYIGVYTTLSEVTEAIGTAMAS